MVDRFPVRTGCFCNDAQIAVAYVADANVRERCRQADRFAEVIDLLNDPARPVRQKQPGKHANRHLLAMIEPMRPLQPREAVVDGMGRRQAGALKAQAAEQRVGLHDVRQRRRDDFLFASDPGRNTVLSDRIVAQPGQSIASKRSLATALVGAQAVRQESASNQVARASPMPATRYRTGASAITCVSTSTSSGFRGTNWYRRKAPPLV